MDRIAHRESSFKHFPAQMNMLIGREQAIVAATTMLRRNDVRLLTLTGPGGVGKTRLAIEIARQLHTEFCDGACFVSLASVRDATLVLATIAQALDLAKSPEISVTELLHPYIRDRHLLLVLDNFEHVIDAGTQIATLLAQAPHVKLLITSREALHLYGEHELEVLPLALPDAKQSLCDAIQSLPAALALFVERVQAVKPSFMLTQENVTAIAEICVQLDGLPLAIELAAARCKLLTPALLLIRLQHRLHILVGGPRDLPTRQQTLRKTLDWSYDLLNESEQRFFYRLGVFTGTWTVEAAAAVADENEQDAFDLLTSLVDKSLVRLATTTENDVRFLLLETIREYALDCLMQHGELEKLQRRHVAYYTRLVEDIEPHLTRKDQYYWLQVLDCESPNLWLAMRWVVTQHEVQPGLRLAGALIHYLQLRGTLGEVYSWFEQILSLESASQTSVLYAKVTYGAGIMALKHNQIAQALHYLEESRSVAALVGDKRMMAFAQAVLALASLEQANDRQAYASALQGLHLLDDTEDIWARGIMHSLCGIIASRSCDFVQAQVHYKVGLSLLRQAGDLHSEADMLVNVGNMSHLRGKLLTAYFLYQKARDIYQGINDRWGQLACLHGMGNVQRLQGKFVEAQQQLDACLNVAAALGSRGGRVQALWELGRLALAQEDITEATRFFKEGLSIARELKHPGSIAHTLQGLADATCMRGGCETAKHYYEQCQSIAQQTGDKVLTVSNLCRLGWIATEQKTYPQAAIFIRQAIQLAWEIGDMVGLATALGTFAWLCGQLNLLERAAQFLGSANRLYTMFNAAPFILPQIPYATYKAWLAERVGETAFHENWMVGQSMTLKQTFGMIAQIHIVGEQPAEPAKQHASYPAGLTMREAEVLCLVAQGLTDVRIAQQLVLSPRTVNTHLRSIYAKLGVSSRSAATRLAVEYKLV